MDTQEVSERQALHLAEQLYNLQTLLESYKERLPSSFGDHRDLVQQLDELQDKIISHYNL